MTLVQGLSHNVQDKEAEACGDGGFFVSRSVAEPEVTPQAFGPKLCSQLPPATVMSTLPSLGTEFCTKVCHPPPFLPIHNRVKTTRCT